MKSRIRELEQIARQLEPTEARRRAVLSKVVEYSEQFLAGIDERPAFIVTKDQGIGIHEGPIEEHSADIDHILELIKDNIDGPGENPASAGHLAYIPGGGIYYSALGDFLADVTNRFTSRFVACPGAVRLENMLLRWMAEMVGYPTGAGGNLTSGGSIAQLIGLITARHAARLQAKDFSRSVVYLTQQAHYSIDRALLFALADECVKRYIPVDDAYRMIPEKLHDAIQVDRMAGLKPWLVVASGGTTNCGAVDPLDAIGAIAAHHQLWYHIDAAYGGFFALCEIGKKILRGLDRSDSIVMDPHKSLFLPYGTGTVLVKDRRKLYEAHHYTGPRHYMDTDLHHVAHPSTDELSPADVSPELTRHFRGLRLWLPLKLLGTRPFCAALEEKILLARYFYDEIQKTDGFEVGPYPKLSIATYRYVPKRGDANAFNQQLIQEVLKDGRINLSSTVLDGKVTLRLAVLSFRTHLDTIEETIEILKEKATYLANM